MTKAASPARPKQDPDVDDPFMSVNEIADFLGVHRANVYRMMSEGRLPYTMIGTRRRVRRSAVATLIESGQ
jgi:excisionase family DNA binding protein